MSKSRFSKYLGQKHNAKHRGIEWKFKFEDWCRVWDESGKWELRGTGKGKYVMGRFGDVGPYSPDNVEIIPFEQNIKDAYANGRCIRNRSRQNAHAKRPVKRAIFELIGPLPYDITKRPEWLLPMEFCEDIENRKSLRAAIDLCLDAGGILSHTEICARLNIDKGQFSRWQSGQEGIKWEKFAALMDVCGNDAPLLWMMHQRGYDLHSLRKRETETERRLRMAEERIAQLEQEARVKADFVAEFMGRRAA